MSEKSKAQQARESSRQKAQRLVWAGQYCEAVFSVSGIQDSGTVGK